MRNYTVDLKEAYGLQGGTLSCILSDSPWDYAEQAPDWKRPALIVVPGGGYGMVSKREGEPVAFEFLAKGFQTFVLTYLVGGENGASYPEQLLELAAAVDYVKKNAEELHINANEVFVVGFSAGGHLVGDLAVEHQNVSQKAGRALDCKPTAVGLCYPVISNKHGHFGSYENLLWGYTDEAKAELLKTLNLDEAVSENTPPAFIWTTAKDNCVPPDNSLRYALALDKKGIDYELHIYPRLDHGTSTANLECNYANGNEKEFRRVSRWVSDCAEFFRIYTQEQF